MDIKYLGTYLLSQLSTRRLLVLEALLPQIELLMGVLKHQSRLSGGRVPFTPNTISKWVMFPIRDRPRFFDQVGHQTTYAYVGNKHFFTKSCHRQTYKNYEQPPQ